MRVMLFLISAAVSASAFAEDIPLKEIWGFGMPETRDARTLDDEQSTPLVEEIQRALSRDDTGPGFVVVGTREQALINAHKVLTSKTWKEPDARLTSDTELSLVFYARLSARHVWVNNVRRNGSKIVVKYEAITHETRDLTTHFALIPLTDLPAGKYDVIFQEMPTLTPGGTAAKKAPEIVCKSFSFEVLPPRR
jgi:hypothetical protein